jgi:hypothetical protein
LKLDESKIVFFKNDEGAIRGEGVCLIRIPSGVKK